MVLILKLMVLSTVMSLLNCFPNNLNILSVEEDEEEEEEEEEHETYKTKKAPLREGPNFSHPINFLLKNEPPLHILYPLVIYYERSLRDSYS